MIFNRIALQLHITVSQVISIFSNGFHSYRSKSYKAIQDEAPFIILTLLPLVHILASSSLPGTPQACSYLRAFALAVFSTGKLFPLDFHVIFSLTFFLGIYLNAIFLKLTSLANWFKISSPIFLLKSKTHSFFLYCFFFPPSLSFSHLICYIFHFKKIMCIYRSS